MIIAKASIDRDRLAERVAVVTGAGQGIGRETARVLAYLGATVVIAEINDSGRETEQTIRAEGGHALFVKTDVSDPESILHFRQQALQMFGEIGILVNNAAYYTTKPILEHTVEEWDRVFAANLRGAFLGIKAFLPDMLQRHEGVVITMESAEGTKQESDARGFFRDPDKLKIALEALRDRRETTVKLAMVLLEVQGK